MGVMHELRQKLVLASEVNTSSNRGMDGRGCPALVLVLLIKIAVWRGSEMKSSAPLPEISSSSSLVLIPIGQYEMALRVEAVTKVAILFSLVV